MCGISGYFSRLVAARFDSELADSLANLAHRGPDGHGIWQNEKVGLAHARLSIIDLSQDASQPMSLKDDHLHISFNGEVYNYKEIRRELEAKGCVFSSRSDTEVILHAYKTWGTESFSRFNGMFALALFDADKEELILVRDRFGIKPLYFYESSDMFFFASELGSLLAFPVSRELDYTSLNAYFQFSYIDENRSILKDIQQLEPGTWMKVSGKTLIKENYYHLSPDSIEISYEEALIGIREQMQKSIARRLIADVPVATFLSSGLDSSIITQLAAEQHHGIAAYSAGFSEFPYYDESMNAKEFGKKLQIDHHSIDLRQENMLESIETILDGLSEPFADSSALAFYELSKGVSKKVKVVLSGDGADELFGGYRKHKAEWMFRNYPGMISLSGKFASLFSIGDGGRNSTLANLKRQSKKWMQASSLSKEERYVLFASMSSKDDVSGLFLKNGKYQQDIACHLDTFNEFLKKDFEQVLKGDMLYKVDRMSMMNGLEVRVPYLDHELVDFVFSLPSEWKLRNGKRKSLLRDAYREILPKQVLQRKKRGFEVPLSEWLKGPLSGMVDELLSKNNIEDQGVLNYQKVKTIIEGSRTNNPGNTSYLVWSMVVFQKWMNKYNPKR